MIKTFRNKHLKALFETGTAAGIDVKFHARIKIVLDVVHAATDPRQFNVQGWKLHQLKQFKPRRWSIWISGAWRITFEYEKGDAYAVDFEQYH